MKVPHSKGVANHAVPESCVAYSEVRREALTGVRIGQSLSRESKRIQRADVFTLTEGNTGRGAIVSSVPALRDQRPCMSVRSLLGNREISGLTAAGSFYTSGTRGSDFGTDGSGGMGASPVGGAKCSLSTQKHGQ